MKKLAILFLISFFSSSVLSSEKMLIGRDERTQIKKRNMTEAHQSVGLIFYMKRNMTYFCSGTIIAPKLVITAAHCVEPNVQIYFIPGQIARIWRDLQIKIPRHAVAVKEAHQFPGYTKNESLTKDIAVLTFEKEFKTRPLSFSSQYEDDEFVSIAGYPTDKSTGTMWEGSGRLTGASYTIDTYGGQSGSALRNERNEVIGIHSHAIYSQNKNFACLLTEEHISFIEKYMN